MQTRLDHVERFRTADWSTTTHGGLETLRIWSDRMSPRASDWNPILWGDRVIRIASRNHLLTRFLKPVIGSLSETVPEIVLKQVFETLSEDFRNNYLNCS